MAGAQLRIQASHTAAKNEIFEVRSLIRHPMETGLRVDQAGQPIRRNIINRFICRYNGAVVFDVRLHEAMAANPFLSFFVRARESGPLSFAWEEDGGAVFVLEAALVVVG